MRIVYSSLALLLVTLAAPASAAGQAAPDTVRGRVVVAQLGPLSGVNVFLLETLEGAVSGPDGSFRFTTRAAGERTLVGIASGYAEARLALTLPAADGITLTMRPAAVALDPIEVRAGRYLVTDAPDATLSALQVVTTPGAQADVFRALQTFPGLQHVDEGAGLFVRGGDVDETKVFLDGAVVLSPYRYESPTGGFFGAFDPFLLDGIVFSSGGFGARYGDALAGVASLETRGRPPEAALGLTASLAALSATASLPLPGGSGAHATATRSHTRLLFDVNGSTSEFTSVPEGRDVSASAVVATPAGGELKVFAIDQWSRLGVVVDAASYSGAFESDERHDMLVASWSATSGAVRPDITAARSGGTRVQRFGAFALDAAERFDQARALVALDVSPRWTVTIGGELERRVDDLAGSVAEHAYDNAPGARQILFDSRVRGVRRALFGEADGAVGEKLRVSAGIRGDGSSLSGRWTADPRLALALRLADGIALSGAWGRYHQVPAPLFYEEQTGDPTLGPMQATHWIAGAQIAREPLLLRVEAYYKTYADLAQRTRDWTVARGGRGTSRGVDVFLRPPPFLGFRTRSAHSFHRSRRTDADAGELARSPFDISYNATTVVERSFGTSWQVAASHRTATGRPFTPILDAALDAGTGVWSPRFGPPMAERLPDFQRTDLSASHLRSLTGRDLTVFFVGVTNALDRENLHGYRYTPDYSERIPVPSQFARSVYFGVSVTF